MQRYADKQGYDFVANVSDVHGPVRTPHWGEGVSGYIPIRGFIKLDLMLHYLDKESCRREYDWVVWLDADLLVTNVCIGLDDCMHARPLVVPFDANGINATVIMAKNQVLVRDLLWAANNAGRTMFLRHDWAEMESLRYFLQTPPYKDVVEYASVKHLCAMPPGVYPIPDVTRKKYEWEPGDFAVHFSALSVEKRTEMAREYVDRLGLLA